MVARWSGHSNRCINKQVCAYCEILTHFISWICSFIAICMESSQQTTQWVRRCWRFSRRPQKENNMLIHLLALQWVCLWYVYSATRRNLLLSFPKRHSRYSGFLAVLPCHVLGEWLSEEGRNDGVPAEQVVSTQAVHSGQTGTAAGREDGEHLF